MPLTCALTARPLAGWARPFALRTALIRHHTEMRWRARCSLRRPAPHAAASAAAATRAAGAPWPGADEDDDVPAEADPDFQAALNEVCNKALRAMLGENLLRVRELREELNELGAMFASQHNMDAALFVYCLLQMTSHTVPAQAERLGGMYKAAYEKLYILLEDSGWALNPEQQASEERGAGEEAVAQEQD